MPHSSKQRAQRVIRLHLLPDYLGVQRSQIAELVRRGKLHPFSLGPGNRSKVVLESEVFELQAEAMMVARHGREEA
jgi:hypothetical protein